MRTYVISVNIVDVITHVICDVVTIHGIYRCEKNAVAEAVFQARKRVRALTLARLEGGYNIDSIEARKIYDYGLLKSFYDIVVPAV